MRKRTKAAGAPTGLHKRRADPVAALAGSIAHDFSNLLMIMHNASAFLKDDLPADDPRQQYVGQLLDAANRATGLTQQLQAMGRSQLLNPELVRPAQIIRGMVDTLRRLIPEDVELRISVRAPHAVVSFDESQLQIVMMNLVAYAAERVGSRGHLLLVVREQLFKDEKIGNSDVVSGKFVSILVARTGQALDELERKHAFAPKLTGKGLPRGTDLRLASVHGVVTQSGGFVDVATPRGKGTVLKVYLPIVAQERPDKAPEPALRIHRDVTGTEVVLVVEDDQSVRRVVREALEYYGYTVIEARDGEEALHLMRTFNSPPDLVLTDLVMPNMTGRELVESLGIEGPMPKVLLMSGYTDDEVLRRAKPSETFLFIRKPFMHYELAAKVREALDS